MVENLYEHFDSHGIAGHKLSQVLWQPKKPAKSKPEILPKESRKAHKKIQMNGSPTSTNSSVGDSHHSPNNIRRPTSTNSQSGDSHATDDDDDWAEATSAARSSTSSMGSPKCGFDFLPDVQRTAIASAIVQRRDAVQGEARCGTATTPRGTTPAPLRGSPPGFPSSPRYRATPFYLNVEPDGQWTAVRRGWCDYCGTLCCVPSHLVSPFGPDDYYG